MEAINAPPLQDLTPITLRARPVGSKIREVPLPGASVTVNEDEFTDVLVDRMNEALKRKNIPVVSNSDRIVEIQVVRVSLQADRTIYCVIDFNRKLGDGDFYGFQSRSKNMNFITSCDEALTRAANDIFNNQETITFLKGE